MRKVIPLLFILLLTGCTVVRIDTKSIDNIIDVVLSKNNKLYNQVGNGYKYYIPRGVTYIESDEQNDKLYCNGNYYYLYIDAVSYYHNIEPEYKEDNSLYYSRRISSDDGFKHSGYLEIKELENKTYKIKYVYNYARFEAIVSKEKLNDTILNATYILSTVKFNYNVVELMLNNDYFTNKAEKYDDFSNDGTSNIFKLEEG